MCLRAREQEVDDDGTGGSCSDTYIPIIGGTMRYDFLVDTYDTERLKVLSVWSEFTDEDLPVRPSGTDKRGRSVHEHMVHQCVSENTWFINMLGIEVGAPTPSGSGDPHQFHPALRRGQHKAASSTAIERGPVVGGRNEVLRCCALPRLGHDSPDCPYIPPSRPTDGVVTDARTRPA